MLYFLYQTIPDCCVTLKHIKDASKTVLSPILFTLCLVDLITELEDNGDGCRIGMK